MRAPEGVYFLKHSEAAAECPGLRGHPVNVGLIATPERPQVWVCWSLWDNKGRAKRLRDYGCWKFLERLFSESLKLYHLVLEEFKVTTVLSICGDTATQCCLVEELQEVCKIRQIKLSLKTTGSAKLTFLVSHFQRLILNKYSLDCRLYHGAVGACGVGNFSMLKSFFLLKNTIVRSNTVHKKMKLFLSVSTLPPEGFL